MRFLACMLLVVSGATASAQTVQIVFTGPKVEKSYAKYLTKISGVNCIVGEVGPGVAVSDRGVVTIRKGSSNNQPATNAFWVVDPGDPGTPPYLVGRDGEKKENPKAKFGLVQIIGDDVLGCRTLDPFRTCVGTAADYDRASAELKELTKTRDKSPKTERAWFDTHGRLLAKLDQLALWLRNLGYGGRAKDVEKEAEKQRKTVAKQAASEREKASLASVKKVPTPPKLTEAAAKAGVKGTFSVVEGKHLRVVYLSDLADEQVVATVELAERVVEGFLREMVDPFVADDFPNQVPDGLIHEFYFGPEDLAIHEKLLVDYYGHAWGKNKQDELKSEGADFYLKQAPHYLSYRKLVKEVDPPGYIIHAIGHSLMDCHYNGGARNDVQDWLREAVGYYVSLAYLGRNGLVCYSTNEEEYAKTRQKIGIKTAQSGIADVMNQVALSAGPTLEQLAIKPLWEITDADFAKAWSFYEFLARKKGREGQLWLRATCKAAGGGREAFVREWRPLTEKAWPVDAGKDVFAALDAEWKAYAAKEQMRGIEAK